MADEAFSAYISNALLCLSRLVARAWLTQAAEAVDPRGVLCLGALRGCQGDDACAGVVAPLPRDPAHRLYELRVRQHRQKKNDSASLAQVEGRNVWV